MKNPLIKATERCTDCRCALTKERRQFIIQTLALPARCVSCANKLAMPGPAARPENDDNVTIVESVQDAASHAEGTFRTHVYRSEEDGRVKPFIIGSDREDKQYARDVLGVEKHNERVIELERAKLIVLMTMQKVAEEHGGDVKKLTMAELDELLKAMKMIKSITVDPVYPQWLDASPAMTNLPTNRTSDGSDEVVPIWNNMMSDLHVKPQWRKHKLTIRVV